MAINRTGLPLMGGVNLHEDPINIPDGQWQRVKNLAARRPGVLGTRPSLRFARDVEPDSRYWDIRLFTASPIVNKPENWARLIRPLRFLFDPNYGELTMVVVTTDDWLAHNSISGVDETFPAGTYLLINLPQVLSNSGGEPIVQVAPLGITNRQPTLFVFDGLTYAFAGGNNGLHIDTPDPSPYPDYVKYAVNDFGAGNTNFNPDGACIIRDRVLYYKGSSVYFSDRNEPLVVGYTGTIDADGNIVPSAANPAAGTNYSAIDTRGIYLGGEELESITAAADLSTTADGSPVQSVVGVWTNTHMYMLLGEPLETTEGGDVRGSLQINKLNIQAGCVSQATVTRTPYGTFWLGADDVWFMPWGSLPIRVGTSIRPLIEAQPPGLRWKLHAEYSDDHYKLALFSEGQGPGLLDPCSTHMWLNLHDGAPTSADNAKWFGPQEFCQTDAPDTAGGRNGPPGTWCMARDTRGAGDGKLYCLQNYIVYSADTRSIYGMSLCGLDTYDGADHTGPIYAVSTWQANYGYYEGTIFVPPPRASAAPYVAPVWVCTTTGTSHATTEPDWLANTATGSITDGTAVWQLKFWDGTYPMPAWTPPLMQGANQVEWSLLSKEHVFGDTMVEKLLDGSEISYVAGQPTQLTYNSHPKQDSASKILTPANEQTAENTTGSTTGDRVWQARQLSASPTKRFHGLSAMWECQQDAGYVITTGVNDTLRIAVGGFPITYTIPAGHYASVSAILTAILAAGAPILFSLLDDAAYTRGRIGVRCVQPLGFYADSALTRLLGFAPSQGAPFTMTYPAYTFGLYSPAQALAPDMQLSAVNIRHRSFGRRPT